ncbi:hypothetical protein OAF00_01275, partial [bacterium]|nr:hypothetical protein [bacterium]
DPNSYISKPALDLMLSARKDPEQPYFLILDEMNLSHVERYFADFLSAIESVDEEIHLHSDDEERNTGKSSSSGGEEEGGRVSGNQIPGKVKLPDNLFVIGTVNVDETTYMFSPKVLDRANVIEFRVAREEMEKFLSGTPKKSDLLPGDGSPLGTGFLGNCRMDVSVPAEVEKAFTKGMLELFGILKGGGWEFGFRVAAEASRYVHFRKLLSPSPDKDVWFAAAMDEIIIQKILPKLHGNSDRTEEILDELFKCCEKKGYILSKDKLGRMKKLLRNGGYTSFAEAS